jgi:dipeptidase E
MDKKLLLISNSICYKQGYLDHCINVIKIFLKKVDTLLFFPYALKDKDSYFKIVKNRFEKINIKVESIHKSNDPKESVKKAQAIFIGGGNTFRLLNELYRNDLVKIIRQQVKEGMLYIGTSAGVNVACPTIKTTNDMPIVQPPSLDALDLIPFQINPHYIDVGKHSKHMGETREQRIKEYFEENNGVVVGLREGSWLRIEENQVFLGGKNGARVFTNKKSPTEYLSGTRLFLLKIQCHN